MSAGIYLIINSITDKFYVGRAIRAKHRWTTHKSVLSKNKHPNEYLQNAWNKYGESGFSFHIIEHVSDPRTLPDREQYWINKLDACNRKIGYNLNPSAYNSSGYKHTLEAIEKIRQNSLRLGLKPPSPLGKELSDDTKAKIGKSNSKPRLSTENMKKPKSEEHKRALSLARTGFKHSEEDRLKRSISAKSKSIWTHENGNKCKCDECRARRNEYYRNKKYKRDRKTV